MPFFSPVDKELSNIFAFKAAPVLLDRLDFERSSHQRLKKRSRPVADVDGQRRGSKKKRRLRLNLITSRLSQPFSSPASHCIDRGQSKIAVWAKQQSLAPRGNSLRKAAIMNRMRRKTSERKDSGISVGEDERRQTREAIKQAAREEMEVGETVVFGPGPNAVHDPQLYEIRWSVPPSPLGLSNYEAFDDGDDWYESYDDSEEAYCPHPDLVHVDEVAVVEESLSKKDLCSDFNLLDFRKDFRIARSDDGEEEGEEDADPFHLNILPATLAKETRLPSPPEDRLIALMREQQKQRDSLAGFLHFS